MEEEKAQLVTQQKTEKTGDVKNIELTVDQVIDDYVGSFGLSQIIQVILVSLAWIFDSQNTLVTIFSDAEPKNWRCKPNFNCHRRQSNKGVSVCGLEVGSWEWVDGHTSSTISEWELICDRKFLAAIPSSCFFLGSLIGSAIYGRLADSILGRKKTLILSCLLTTITAFLTSLSPNIWVYALLRFSNGLTRSGIGICCLVLSTEAVGRKWRGQVGQYGFFFFTAGFLSLPLIAYPIRSSSSWRSLYLIISIFPFLYSIFILIPFVAESPRWLLIRGRKNEAITVLRKFAKLNGREIPVEIQLLDPIPSVSNSGQTKNPNMGLWECKWARIQICNAMLAGLGLGFVYYGIQLNVENLNFSKYLSSAINALMEIPAVFIGSLLLGCTNRRLLFSLSSAIAGVSCLLCVVFSKGRGRGDNWIQLGFEGVGFMAASMAFDVLYIYCVELFPTNVRNFAVSLLRQALMLGASMAPLLVVVGRLRPEISFMVFGGFAIGSGLVSLWLPETRNAPLYETLEQQEKDNLCKRGSCEHGLELGESKS